MDMYIEVDGEVAKIELPDTGDEEDGYWESLEAEFPNAYDLIDEEMVIPGYGGSAAWDVRFGPGEDEALTTWIKKGKLATDGWVITVDGEPDLDGEDMIFESRSAAIEFIDSCPCYDGLGERVKAEPWISYSNPEQITTFKQIRISGRTLIVYVKEECDRLGISYGDWVEVTIRKTERHD